jgi:hypothetical protein
VEKWKRIVRVTKQGHMSLLFSDDRSKRLPSERENGNLWPKSRSILRGTPKLYTIRSFDHLCLNAPPGDSGHGSGGRLSIFASIYPIKKQCMVRAFPLGLRACQLQSTEPINYSAAASTNALHIPNLILHIVVLSITVAGHIVGRELSRSEPFCSL